MTIAFRPLVPAIRASLNARLERLLARPLIAEVVGVPDEPSTPAEENALPDVFRALDASARQIAAANPREKVWREDPADGTCLVRIAIDYDDLWRGREKELLEAVANTVEGSVTFLTREQKRLLERSPREFLALHPPPESAELVSFEREYVGGVQRVVELRLAQPPESRAHIRHVAIVPNLVQIERQLSALTLVEAASDDGPLAALRQLVGLSEPPEGVLPPPAGTVELLPGEKLDEFQRACVGQALATPHFAVIQGPPGSGKTTVISGIIRRARAKGQKVLVVSPTHVAVDNVVEKLAPRSDAPGEDRLEPETLPVRYAARDSKLSPRSLEYWVGAKKQRRAVTVSRRLERVLRDAVPFAEALYALEDREESGRAPLSAAVAQVESVICGTPIGILSYESVKNAPAAAFDLLIVDEVSKMTLSEFLAVAVKAKRWVLVGDPQQLPPYNNSEENGTTLDDLLEPVLELACSAAALVERAKPFARREVRAVVVAAEPEIALEVIRAQLSGAFGTEVPPVALLTETTGRGVVVCGGDEVADAYAILAPLARADRMHHPDSAGSVTLLVERGVAIPRPAVASGMRLVENRERAQAQVFENAFQTYHARPWSERSGQLLAVVRMRNGLDKYLPHGSALATLAGETEGAAEKREELVTGIAERFAVNTVSVYDWLSGIPTESFDVSPLKELADFSPRALCAAVRPYVGTLKKQYRMHSSLSRAPRELFYFGEALHDGKPDAQGGDRVRLVPVSSTDNGESNSAEVEAIVKLLGWLGASGAARGKGAEVMIITPYRQQERAIGDALEELRARGALEHVQAEVCTLDRCQGREADYVLLSLVRSRATAFLDMPKRWNVALTRAKEGLFVVGNVEAYLEEARRARSDPRAEGGRTGPNGKPGRPLMSLLARIIETYHRQIEAAKAGAGRGNHPAEVRS